MASQAAETARAIIALFDEDRTRLAASGKSTATTLSVHTYLQHHPVANTTGVKAACGLSLPTVLRALSTLEAVGIVQETTGKGRHKIFVYQSYLDILNRGTEPLR